MPDREFDLVPSEATGLVGRLTAQYIAGAAQPGARIARAARSPNKLAVVHADVGSAAAEWTLLQADSTDPGNQIAAALGIVTHPSPDSVAAQHTLGLDVTGVNVDAGATLPMPTVVVFDAAGIIRWIDVHPNYATRTEVADIIAAVDAVS